MPAVLLATPAGRRGGLAQRIKPRAACLQVSTIQNDSRRARWRWLRSPSLVLNTVLSGPIFKLISAKTAQMRALGELAVISMPELPA